MSYDAEAIRRQGTRLEVLSPSGLVVEASTVAHDGVLEQFYKDYDKAFVLENEKEAFDGFAECLALNSGKRYEELVRRFGPFREFVLVARDSENGSRIGGANFIATPLRHTEGNSATIISVHLNYIFVNPPVRRQGYFTRLIRDLPEIVVRLFAETNHADLPAEWLPSLSAGSQTPPPTLIFLEQNDPYRMSPEDYEVDTRYTGLDQMARVSMWAHLGARIVDFPYVQPPLSSDQDADPNLLLAVLGTKSVGLDSCLLRGHLERFFGISVLKGRDPYHQSDSARQLVALDGLSADSKAVPLLAVPTSTKEMSHTNSRPASLRDALRAVSQP
jgi:GNAT superfamily N-acetyltransferase